MSDTMRAVLEEMARSPLLRSDGRLKMQFWISREEVRRRTVRSGAWAGLAVYVLFAFLDLVIVPDAAHLTIPGRLIGSIVTVACLEITFRQGASADALDRVAAFFLFTIFQIWIWTSSQTVHAELFAYYVLFGNIFMAGATLFFTFRVPLSLLCCGGILATMVYALFLSTAFSATLKVLHVLFYVSCFVFTLIVNVRINAERYRTFLNETLSRLHQQEVEDRGAELLTLTNTDYLTGVENRRSLDTGLEAAWQDWREAQQPFSATLIDVDHFKKFNDGNGHVRGDDCLKTVARVLSRVVMARDGRIGRYGGEEFMAIARVRDEADAVAFGEELRAAVEAGRIDHGYRLDGTSIVTVSVGLGFTGARAPHTVERLVTEADQALYAAKESGRNAVVLYDPDDPLHNDASEATAALLKQALELSLLSLAYQPIVNVATGRIEGVEALMRLRTPDGAAISPADFIPVAERTGAIVPLGRWALLTVCRDILAPGLVPLASVNVSAVQLQMRGFSMQVAAILMETGVPGHRLALEITEGRRMEIDATVLKTIRELKDLGVRIWLDDFGTGFAGLSWLRTIGFDKVKIDKSFLYAADHPEGRTLLEDIITLIRRRGATILVEGVETEEQLAFMRATGVDEAQGYYLGRPAGIEAAMGIPPFVGDEAHAPFAAVRV